MDIKSIKNKLRVDKIPLEIRVSLSIAVCWLIGVKIVNLPYGSYSTSTQIASILEAILWISFGLLFLVIAQIAVRPPAWREQWQSSRARVYVRIWENGLRERRIAAWLLAFILLSALAGMCAWRLYDWYRSEEEKWLILFEIFYVFFVLPYVLHFVGKFGRIRAGAKEIAEGRLDATIQVGGDGLLSELAGHLNNMKHGYRSALDERMRSERLKSELITNVTHDLKTPLTSIINYVDLLKKKDLSPDQTEAYVGVLDKKSQRLKTLIEDLTEASKMASGAVELDMRTIDVAALLNQALAEFGDQPEENPLPFRVNIASPHIHANLDGNKTWRVFENLIGNARKYSLPGTRVYVYLAETDDRVLFRIQNTSSYEIDFAAEELFERFKRADQSRHTEGSGLGLAIAKSIVELQGGEIAIEIEGDQFNVRIAFPK
ncbi:HAMP domain-containing sensor histidine kinase [Cohnella endophytica]|nr:sensor histidine kinase [Cohnella endophytica]